MNVFLERLKAIIPKEHYADVVASFSQPPKTGVRLNPLRSNDPSLIPSLISHTIEPTWIDNTYLVDASEKEILTHSEAFANGEFYIQSLSSMLPALLLELAPGQEILDLCAAPGSKTSQMAALIHNDGHIAAVERNKKRFFKLQDNLKRQGVTCVKTFLRDGKTVYQHCADKFDRVLVDAPCSSESRFDTNNPDTYKYWDEKNIKQIARDQWQLLYSGFVSLKPGGILVYSTCTFAPEENEAVVNKLFKKFGDQVTILPIELPLTNTQPGLLTWRNKTFDKRVQDCLRILPSQSTEGFFLTKIQKNHVASDATSGS